MSHDLLKEELKEIFCHCGSRDLIEELKQYSIDKLNSFLFESINRDAFHLFHYLLDLGANPIGTMQHGFSPIHLAAQQGKIPFVKKLLTSGASIDLKDEQGRSPLSYAANKGQRAMVDYLVGQGADIHMVTEMNLNLLHTIAFCSDEESEELYELAEDFLEKGINPLQLDAVWKMMPFHIAMKHKNVRLGQLFLNHGTPIDAQDGEGWGPLHWAASLNKVDMVDQLFEKGANIDLEDNTQSTPLMHAIMESHVGMAERLIERGANIHLKNVDELTPLHMAFMNRLSHIAKLLIVQGADIHAKDRYSRTPFFWCASIGDMDSAQFLIEQGAQIDEEDDDGCTPLFEAALRGHEKMVFFFIEKGASIHRLFDGATLLHIASGYYDKEKSVVSTSLTYLASYLIENGLDIHAKTKHGTTPLHHAVQKNGGELVELLIEKGVDIHALGEFKRGLLHYAAFEGCVGVCRILIEQGAKIDEPDEDGFTPLLLASSEGHKGIVLELLNHDVVLDPDRIEMGSLLLDAANRGWFDVAKMAISKGADVNRKTMHGVSVLELSKAREHHEITQLLVKHGAQ